MRRLIYLFIALVLGAPSNALYNENSDVISLTPKNFDKVLQSSEIWIVEFFAPWCGHCQNLVPAYEEAARGLKGVVKVAAVDVDAHKELGGRYNIQGFPTIKIFGADKNSPESYEGPRTSKGLIEAALSAIRRKVDLQSGGSRSSGGGGGGGGSDKSEDVIELTESNFKTRVLDSDDLWLVEFYAPWCGHCKNLAPTWAAAATELKGKVKLGAVDATVHQSLAGQYGIKGYPTIKFFPSGKKDSSSVEDYNGDRSKDGIVTWALNKLAESLPPPEIRELVDDEVLKDACENHPLCVISILPHILDCQSDCRNSYLKMLNAMGEKYKQKMWGWVWAEAAAQPQLESALEMGGFGYPAMAVLNNKKKKFSILRGSFSKEGINEFLRDLSYGRVSSIAGTLRGDLPTLDKREAWDGKDAELPVEDDIDLSDVDLDDGKDEL